MTKHIILFLARAFAIGFYGALGDHESVAAAYRHGNAAISLEGLSEAERPQLKVRNELDAAQLVLAAITPPVRTALPCPYPGMRPYSAEDADAGRSTASPPIAGPRPPAPTASPSPAEQQPTKSPSSTSSRPRGARLPAAARERTKLDMVTVWPRIEPWTLPKRLPRRSPSP